uniref:Large polyvalent protein associated domain-containing protein n=1 Tax=viral metagenome TaxID=1070528 RepID=A0A6M3J4T3_9ZZZZ
MSDIFDDIQPEQKTDIFDEVSVPDIFDQISSEAKVISSDFDKLFAPIHSIRKKDKEPEIEKSEETTTGQKIAKIADFFTGHFSQDKDIPEVENRTILNMISGKDVPSYLKKPDISINVPGSAEMSAFNDPVTALAFGGVAGARAVRPLVGKLATAAQEAAAWATGGVTDIPKLAKAGAEGISRAASIPAEAKRMALLRAKGVPFERPVGAVMPRTGEEISAAVSSPALRLIENKRARELPPPDEIVKPGETPQGKLAVSEEQAQGQQGFKWGSQAADVGGYADRGGYSPSHANVVELPELVDVARELGGGKLPRILEKLRAGGIQRDEILGMFKPVGQGSIDLKADIFEDPVGASKTLAHEIGHWIDYLPDKTMKRGNILGRIGSLKKYFDNFLEEFPNAPLKVLTDPEKEIIRQEAKRQAEMGKGTAPKITPVDILAVWNNVEVVNPKLSKFIAKMSDKEKVQLARDAMKGSIPEWFKFNPSAAPGNARKIFEELLAAEVERRHLWKKEDIMGELKILTQQWKPFDIDKSTAFTSYRHSSQELYADAFSVLLNEPTLLEQTAPKFQKAFFNFLERKPQVKQIYEDTQSLISSGGVFEKRMGAIDEAFAKGESIRKGMAEVKQPLDIFKWLKRELIDVNTGLIQKKKLAEKAGRKFTPEENPVYWVEELPYVSGEVFQYLRDVDRFVKNPATKAGLSESDIGKYMFLNRASTELKEKAVPWGEVGDIAKKDMDKLRNLWGADKYNQVQQIVDGYQGLRSKSIVPLLEKAGMYDEKLMSKIRDNREYARFNVLSYMEKQYGSQMAGEVYRQIDPAYIHKLVGTLSPIENPLTATIMKDAALIRAANIKMAKASTVNMMLRDFPSDIKTVNMIPQKSKQGGKIYAPDTRKPENFGEITYLEGGKVKSFYVPKEIAESFNKDPYEASILAKIAQYVSAPIKAILVSHNPAWALWNVQRDVRSFAVNVPSANLSKAAVAMAKAVPDTVREMRGISTPATEAMYKGKMLPINRLYDASGLTPETQLDRLLMAYGQTGATYESNVLKPFRKVWDALGMVGKFSEKWTKIAGYKYLKEEGKYSDKEIAHIVRSRLGTPDIMRAGSAKQLYNNIFLFSNVGKEGIRSAIESAKESPMAYVWKLAKYDIAPKIAMLAAGSGLLGAKYKQMMDNIPEREKANYMTVPVGMTKNGSTVYFVLPHDFQGQLISGALWKSWNINKTKTATDLMDYMAGGLPYSGLNPVLGMTSDWMSYAKGKNPYDEFTGRPVIPEQAFTAGGKYAFNAMARSTFNKTFGTSVYTFKGEDVGAVKSELEKVLSVPVVGKVLGRFIRVSNRGQAEELRGVADKVKQARAAESIEQSKAIAEDLRSKAPKGPDRLFTELVQQGTIKHKLIGDPLGSFKTRYKDLLILKANQPLFTAYMNAASTEEKAAILAKALQMKQGNN